MAIMTKLLNGLLVVTSSYAIYNITPSYPFAFTSNVFALCHGLHGFKYALQDEDTPALWFHMLEVTQLALINLQLYLLTDTSLFGLCHGLFIVPLLGRVFKINFKGYKAPRKNSYDNEEDYEEYEESAAVVDVNYDDVLIYREAQQLSLMTFLGNVASLLYLAVCEENWTLGGMVAANVIIKFLSHYYILKENGYETFCWIGEAFTCVLSVMAMDI